ncbi:MAG: LPS assembly lipoprotein LptE [Thiohalospira sp.]
MARAAALLLALLLLLPAGCGWQLRGGFELPPALETVRVTGGSEQIRSAITLGLRGSGARVVSEEGEEGEAETATLRILSSSQDQRTLSTDSQGRALEYELTEAVTWEVVDAEGEEMVPRQTTERSREFLFDPDNVLGKSSEMDRLRESMRRDLAMAILRQMEARAGATDEPDAGAGDGAAGGAE